MGLHALPAAWPALLAGVLAGLISGGTLARAARRRPRVAPPRRGRHVLRRARALMPVLVACSLWGVFLGIVAARFLFPRSERASQSESLSTGDLQAVNEACPAESCGPPEPALRALPRPLPRLPSVLSGSVALWDAVTPPTGASAAEAPLPSAGPPPSALTASPSLAASAPVPPPAPPVAVAAAPGLGATQPVGGLSLPAFGAVPARAPAAPSSLQVAAPRPAFPQARRRHR